MDNMDFDAPTWPYQLTKVMHRSMYPLLEPASPALTAAVDDKNVLITGVSGGVGKVCAEAIAEAWAIAGPANIVITGRKKDVLDDVAKELRNIGIKKWHDTRIFVLPADLTDEKAVKDLWEKAHELAGHIDVLINDAGTMNYAPIGDIEPGQWWRDFEVNVKGAYLMIHHFLQQFAQIPDAEWGTVITINTGASGSLLPNMSSYISSKLAQNKMMEFLNIEHPKIRSFTVLPGLLRTAMTAEAYLPFARDDPMLTGGMSLFLCTERADWLRGGVVSVNWDIEEMEAHKEEILLKGLTKLGYLNAQLGKGGHPWEGSHETEGPLKEVTMLKLKD